MEPWERGGGVLHRGHHACKTFLFGTSQKGDGSLTDTGELSPCEQWCQRCAEVVYRPVDPLRAGVGGQLGELR